MRLKLYIIPSLLAVLLLSGCWNRNNEIEMVSKTYENGQAEHIMIYKLVDGDSMLLKSRLFYETGELKMEGSYNDNGEMEGTWTAFFKDGSQWTLAEYKNDQENGSYTVWHPSGEIYYSGQMDKGVRTGIWKFYNSTGELDKEIDYSE